MFQPLFDAWRAFCETGTVGPACVVALGAIFGAWIVSLASAAGESEHVDPLPLSGAGDDLPPDGWAPVVPPPPHTRRHGDRMLASVRRGPEAAAGKAELGYRYQRRVAEAITVHVRVEDEPRDAA